MSSQREHKTGNFNFSIGNLHPSKFLVFLSLQIDRMTHNTFQILPPWCFPTLLQNVNKWTTVLGITHKTPNSPNTKDHDSLVCHSEDVDNLSSPGLVSLLAGKVSYESVISFKFNSRICFLMECEPFNVCYALVSITFCSCSIVWCCISINDQCVCHFMQFLLYNFVHFFHYFYSRLLVCRSLLNSELLLFLMLP